MVKRTKNLEMGMPRVGCEEKVNILTLLGCSYHVPAKGTLNVHSALPVQMLSHAHEHVCFLLRFLLSPYLSLLDSAVRRREGVWVVSWQQHKC